MHRIQHKRRIEEFRWKELESVHGTNMLCCTDVQGKHLSKSHNEGFWV